VNTTPTWNTLTLDESLALRTAATRLAGEFEGVFAGWDVPGVRPVRDEIECRVRNLLYELDLPVQAALSGANPR
jgi:hypothetical protein